MKVYSEIRLVDFQTWSGATKTKDLIIEHDKAEEFEYLIEDLYPDGISETNLNDLLWFDSEFILEQLEIETIEEDERN